MHSTPQPIPSEAAEAGRGGSAAAPASGLVGQVTSHTRTTTYPTTRRSEALAVVNRERRFRRMRRCVIGHADAVREVPGFRSQGIMVTLTYREDESWNRKQVSRYITAVRNWLARRGVQLRYEWVIELTRRGRPHYHVLFWVPHGVRIPKPDLSGQWGHGLSKIELARKPVGYLVKYATKGTDGDLPKGGRLFGCGGEPAARFVAHRRGLPSWLDQAALPDSRLVRVPFVGWVERETGAVHRSPYSFVWGRDASGLITLEVSFCG